MTEQTMAGQGERQQEKVSAPAWWRALVAALLLSVALGWMIYDRARILRDGHEIMLKPRPVDPRHLLLGHYARLDYGVNRISADKVDGMREWCEREKRSFRAGALPRRESLYGRPILVALRKGDDGYWHFAGASLRGMAAMKIGIAPADAVIIAGRLKNHHCASTLRVEYGIERYFAPKERALELERMARRRTAADNDRETSKTPLGVIVRVHPGSGKAVIAGLLIDGEKIYEEPLF